MNGSRGWAHDQTRLAGGGAAIPPSLRDLRSSWASALDGRWHRAGGAALAALGLGTVAALVARFDVTPVLAALLSAGAIALMLLHPGLAAVTVVVLLYSNIPGVGVKLYGLPQAAAGSFILLLGIPLVDTVLNRRQPFRVDPTWRLMLAFLVMMLLASVGARDKAIAFDRVTKFAIEGLLLYWLLINTVRTERAVRHVIAAAVAGGVLLGSLTVYQSVTGEYEQDFGGLAERQLAYEYKREAAALRGEVYQLHRADRAGGPQLGPNRYGQIMIVLLPLAAFLYRQGRSARLRLSAAVAGGLILFGGVILTYSRGTLLALAVLVGAAAVVKWIRSTTVAVAAICALLLLPVVAPALYYRVSTLGAVTALNDPSEADGSLRGRATEMLAALHAFADHPLLGVGPGQYTPFYSMDYQQISDIQFRQIDESRRAHTLYLEMAAELGIVGVTLFVAIPLLLLRDLWRARRQLGPRHAELADLATALCLSLVAFLVTACFLSHAFERYYWFLLAIAGASLMAMRSRVAETASANGRPGR